MKHYCKRQMLQYVHAALQTTFLVTSLSHVTCCDWKQYDINMLLKCCVCRCEANPGTRESSRPRELIWLACDRLKLSTDGYKPVIHDSFTKISQPQKHTSTAHRGYMHSDHYMRLHTDTRSKIPLSRYMHACVYRIFLKAIKL